MKMSKDEYERLILDKNKERIRFDNQICKGATLKDVDRALIKEFIIKGKSERGLDLSEKMSVQETHPPMRPFYYLACHMIFTRNAR